MTLSQMRRSVGEAVLLTTCREILFHHWSSRAYDELISHEVFANFTSVVETLARQETNNATSLLKTSTGLVAGNAPNNTAAGPPNPGDIKGSSFYRNTLPEEVLVAIILTLLQYYWHIWLERTFPARPRGTLVVSHESDKFSDGENDEAREAEVVQKWIAQGKVRRASLSWWNTAVKWMLHLSVGLLWMTMVESWLRQAYAWKLSLATLLSNHWELLFQVLVNYFSLTPLAMFVALIVIPAPKRVVFMAGCGLLTVVLIGSFINFLIPWAADKEFVRDMLGNATERMVADATKSTANNMTVGNARLIDEL